MAGNNGGGKPGGGKGQRRLQQRARRDVRLSHQPQLNAIDRLIAQQNADFQNKWQGYGSIYSGEQAALQPLYKQYTNRTQDILPDLQQQYKQFAGVLNAEGLPTNELQANTALAGQYGNNAANVLSNNQQRMLGYDQSALRESALSERYGKQNLMQGLSDQLQQLYNQQSTIYDQMAPEIKQRMDVLRDQAQQNRQDKAYADLIAQLTGNALDSGRNGGGGGGGGGGPSVTSGGNQPGAGVQSTNTWNSTEGRGPGVAGVTPNAVWQWQHNQLPWGDLNQRQRRRIRRQDLVKYNPKPNSYGGNASAPGGAVAQTGEPVQGFAGVSNQTNQYGQPVDVQPGFAYTSNQWPEEWMK